MKHPALPLTLLLLLGAGDAIADGSSIGKVYLPYVQPLEKEIEYRFSDEHYHATGVTDIRHKLGVGSAFGERWFVELYGVAEDGNEKPPSMEATELEVRYQLSEQGEYAADWAVQCELERYHDMDAQEVKVGFLTSRDFASFTTVANLFLIREWGSDIVSENELSASVQARYRLGPSFEPGLEYFASEETRALGPVIMGELPISSGQKLFWHLGYIFGLDDDTADRTVKLQLEYEFL